MKRSEGDEDPEINGLTCPGYYERKLADVEAKLAEKRAGYAVAYRRSRALSPYVSFVGAGVGISVALLLGWRVSWHQIVGILLHTH